MGQIIRGTKKTQKAVSRITVQVQSEDGKIEVLELDGIGDKSDEKAQDVVIQQRAEFCNARHISIDQRVKCLRRESDKMSRMDKLADQRRDELEKLLKEDAMSVKSYTGL